MRPATRFYTRLALFLFVLAGGTASAADWKVDMKQSRLGFVATYEKTPFEAWFRRYDALIRFDPAALKDSRFDVTVDISSVDSDSSDRDEGMQGKEWFDRAAHPQAHFVATAFTAVKGDQYEATGKLTLKGATREIHLPFSWTRSADGARLHSETSLNRTDFNIGSGAWAQDPTIGYEVKVRVDLVLSKP